MYQTREPAQGLRHSSSAGAHFDRHDADGANDRADRKVDDRILLAVRRHDAVDHEKREESHESKIKEESYDERREPC
jgi:hypothetical protein